jgi:hypothetical protein
MGEEDCRMHARIDHEFLGPAACLLDPPVPLFARKRGVGKIVWLLAETAHR